MDPYYQDEAVTIWLGDCREILGSLSAPAAIICDPPYGTVPATVTTGRARNKFGGNWGDMSLVKLMVEATLEPARWPPHVLWFCNHLAFAATVPVMYRNYTTVQSIVWDKDRLGMGAHFRKQTEFIVYARNHDSSAINGTRRDLIRTRPPEKRFHPAEKPIGLMAELIGALDVDSVCDPYMGSGSTLLAAKAMGRRAVGIEIEEKYAEIAARRMEQEVLPLDRPATAPAKAEQEVLPLMASQQEGNRDAEDSDAVHTRQARPQPSHS